ncbi:MAG: class II aldolase/adducin family protein [Chitinispirillales bacterium]|jgi:rhamnose utilization protein RhaD (predicted bifunctional aldolase and dehydrogenase)|nr:class II aldolase/adducin family protein [Chitinispirillales bacterium]
MRNLWSDADEQACVSRYAGKYHHNPDTEKEILGQAYATALLGADNGLTMHGGGNTSIKVDMVDGFGKRRRALYVKATGTPLKLFEPEHFVVMSLEGLGELKSRGGIDDADMARVFERHRLVQTDRLPSIESLMHASVPARIVDHSHPEALLKIANRAGGGALLAECFGDDLAVIPYARMGCDFASAVFGAAERNPICRGVVIVHHGLVVWGDGAREVYDLTIDIVNRAEKFLSSMASEPIKRGAEVSAAESEGNYRKAAPLIKEALGDNEISLILLNTPDVMELINSPDAGIVRNPPLTPDYPMLRRILPLWLDIDLSGGAGEVSSRVKAAVDKYVKEYGEYLEKRGVLNQPVIDLLPRAIVHPRTGVVCFGTDEASARAAADFTRQAFSIRRTIFETGGVYQSLSEEYLFDMQYRGYQRAKRDSC